MTSLICIIIIYTNPPTLIDPFFFSHSSTVPHDIYFLEPFACTGLLLKIYTTGFCSGVVRVVVIVVVGSRRRSSCCSCIVL